MNLYSKAPVISRMHHLGTLTEGVIPDHETNLTFNHAVENYGYLVPKNRYMTGGQWISQIEATYGTTDLRHQAVVRAIESVMLVDQFKDDHIVVQRGSGEALFRGKSSDCFKFVANNGGACTTKHHPRNFDVTPTRVLGADTLLQADENTRLQYLVDNFANGQPQRDGVIRRVLDRDELEAAVASGEGRSLLDLGAPYDVLYFPKGKRDVLVRVLDLLLVSPVGKSAFTSAQHEDREACVELIALLGNVHGYGALVTSANGISLQRAAKDKPKVMLHPVMVESSMMDFIESLEEAGWEGDSDLFLCRPAPCCNTLLGVRRYESVVHNQLIGWRVPRGVVELLADELHELQGQVDKVQRHGERAI